MFVGPGGAKTDFLSTAGTHVALAMVTATWQYQEIGSSDKTAQHARPDSETEWRKANASVALRSHMDPDALQLLRREPDRHRFKLVLTFDRDQLHIRWQVQRWR